MTFQYSIQAMINMVNNEGISVAAIAERLKKNNYDALEGIDWEVADDICEGIISDKWELLTFAQKTERISEIVNLWPTYSTSSNLFKLYIREGNSEQIEETHFWLKLLALLHPVGSKCSETIEYVLWVDFFEDSSTCERAWSGLMTSVTNKSVRDRLIVNAGPVPYHLKKPIYDEIALHADDHATLAESLARSLDDVFGSIDREDAKSFLRILKLSRTNKFIIYLNGHL